MELLIFWALCGVAASIAMSSKGRSGFGGFLLGLFLGPIGLVIALVLPRAAPPEPDDVRACPYCAEAVKKSAIRCRHCQAEIVAWE